MRTTSHPGIVKLISFSESPEHYFLVLERELPADRVSSSF